MIMSAATNYVQRFINLKYAFDTDPRFSPASTGLAWRLTLGIEITIVEANRCDTYYDSGGTFHASISPGQKSYIRGPSSEFINAIGGFQVVRGKVQPATSRVGLRCPAPDRWYAYDPARTTWVFDTPFQYNAHTQLESVAVSLVPFGVERPIGSVGLLEPPDDRVHVLVRHADHRSVLLSNVTLDETTQQLRGYGPSMEPVDDSSLWILSFYIAPGVVD
jgi:hypothetical protein